MWSERNQRGIEGDPPCGACRVDLLPENVDAQEVFYSVRYQLIMGPMNAIDIRHDAIWRLIDEMKIKRRLECFEKITALARRWWIPKLNEKKESNG
jgi:hypothetical protein